MADKQVRCHSYDYYLQAGRPAAAGPRLKPFCGQGNRPGIPFCQDAVCGCCEARPDIRAGVAVTRPAFLSWPQSAACGTIACPESSFVFKADWPNRLCQHAEVRPRSMTRLRPEAPRSTGKPGIAEPCLPSPEKSVAGRSGCTDLGRCTAGGVDYKTD